MTPPVPGTARQRHPDAERLCFSERGRGGLQLKVDRFPKKLVLPRALLVQQGFLEFATGGLMRFRSNRLTVKELPGGLAQYIPVDHDDRDLVFVRCLEVRV